MKKLKLHYQKNRILTISQIVVVGTMGVFFTTATINANNLYGDETCGPELSCSGTETCQIRFRDILPITEPNPILQDNEEGFAVRYECVEAPQLRAPNSVYRGPQRSDGYNTVIPRGTAGVPVNLINVTDPIPVDIFNPNPVPTNIVAPSPIPVVVVDDLAVYHQSKLDEAQAQISKSQAQNEVVEKVAQEITENNLQYKNAWREINELAFQTATVSETGTLPALFTELANSPYENLTQIESQILSTNPNQRVSGNEWLQEFTEFSTAFENECPNVTLSNAGQASFRCMMLALKHGELHLKESVKEETLVRQVAAEAAQRMNIDYPFKTVFAEDNNPFTGEAITSGKLIEELAKEALVRLPFENLYGDNPCFAYAMRPMNKLITNLTQDGVISGLVTETESEGVVDLGFDFEQEFTVGLLGSAQCELQNSTLGTGLIGNIFKTITGEDLREQLELIITPPFVPED